MRLLEARKDGHLTLKSFSGEVPPYAILSHTWGADETEVSFKDIVHAQAYRCKNGFAKIEFCRQQSRKDGIDHFWVDTCCINKADAVELQTAITSMYRWYREARKCYVFLSDVSHAHYQENNATLHQEASLKYSRWFTRGWTLQELIAPTVVEFYSQEGTLLGTKETLNITLSRITGIPSSALLHQKELSAFTVAKRMSWVKLRSTTKPQDKVYCLFGLFGVSTFINYGEDQDTAYARLADAITDRYQRREFAGLEHNFAEHKMPPRMLCTSSDRNADHGGSVQREAIMKSLRFERMDTRRKNIRKEYRLTCSWILQHLLYKQWNDRNQLKYHRGLLWIRGKPGCGKSTLMRYLCAEDRPVDEKAESDIRINYFFHARGQNLEHSVIGMYRSLLHQLLCQVPQLQHFLDRYAGKQEDDWDWTVDDLCETFADALMGVKGRRIKCFVDALDECDDRDIREALWFFEDIGERALHHDVHLLVCFASRHYPTFDLSYGLRLMLEDEPEHNKGLFSYIKGRLRVGSGDYAEEIEARLSSKAKGIFMWAILVLDIVNKEFERGYLSSVEKRLSGIPNDLSDVFRDILRRDRENMAEFELCIQWTLFARRPLRPKEFYVAMINGLDPNTVILWTEQTIDDEIVSKYVSSASKGLVEIAKSPQSTTVQFIHESVRDFLLRHGGLDELFANKFDHESPESMSGQAQTLL